MLQTGLRIYCANPEKVAQECKKPIVADDFNGFLQLQFSFGWTVTRDAPGFEKKAPAAIYVLLWRRCPFWKTGRCFMTELIKGCNVAYENSGFGPDECRRRRFG